ncbi:MAG: hypothetical protein HY903_05135 [Deltaproteobacteria bacterium]|nr:hypothetical protein [Deltaproteobacteria bacterium]
MSNVRDVGSSRVLEQQTTDPTPSTGTSTRTEVGQTATTARTTGTTATAPQDTTTRVRGQENRAFDPQTVLGAPAAPSPTLGENEQRGAESFAANLLHIGDTPTTTENMLAQYLKLQMEGQSMNTVNELMSTWMRQNMMADAAADTKTSKLDEAAALRSQAGQYENQANQILDDAGVDKDLAESCYDRAKAAGKTDAQALAMYKEERLKALGDDPDKKAENEAQVEREAAALTEAAPLAEQADNLYSRAAALESSYATGLGTTNAIRAGTIGLQALLKNEEAQVEIANNITALLAGQRPDQRRLHEAWKEVDQQRNDVAKLVLDLIDARQSAGAMKNRSVRS